jgi:hypothetical protein
MVGFRVAVAAAAAAVWVPVVLFAVHRADSDLSRLADLVSTANPESAREDQYLEIDNWRRVHAGPPEQFSVAEYHNPQRLRILVLGDSFTYPTGLVDLDARWPKILESIMDAATAPGSFEVVSLAAPGASTFSHAEWVLALDTGSFETLPAGLGAGAAFAMPFDAVVVGYFENDIFAGRYDTEVPQQLRDPLGPDAPRWYEHISAESEAAVVSGSMRNPNEVLLDPARRTIWSFAGSVPAVWVPLGTHPVHLRNAARVAPAFAEAGFVIAPTPHGDDLRARYDAESLMVSPTDLHAGTALLRSFAADAAAALFDVLDPVAVAAAVSGAIPPSRPSVSNMLPVGLSVASGVSSATVVHDPAAVADPDDCTRSDTEPVLVECVHSGGLLRTVWDSGDADLAVPQLYPCFRLGRPFALVVFDGDLGSNASVSVIAGSGVLFSYGYDPSGFEQFSELGPLTPGGRITLASDSVGFAVGSSATGCSAPALDAFELSVVFGAGS